MTIQLTFRIRLHSDYHISAGHGWGAVLDSALHRDADGVPAIRGTTLTGLLRQGLHDLATTSAVKDKNLALTEKPADVLFGAPSHPKRWRISSARPIDMSSPQAMGNKHWRTGGQGAEAAAHVRVDPALRRAEKGKLFVREEGDQRLEFAFTTNCEEVTEETLKEAALLVAAARMVRHLGAGRRRGRGWCSIRLQQVTGWPVKQDENQPNEEGVLQRFEDWWLLDKRMTDTVALVQKPQFTIPDRTGQQLRLVIVLRADEPILIARRAEAANQFDGLEYIPGFVLRGALAGLAANRHDLTDITSSVYQAFTRLFFRNGVRLSPLYPAYAGGPDHVTPTIPSPQDLFINELNPRQRQLAGDYPVYNARQAAHKDFKDTANGVGLKLELADRFLAVAPDLPLPSVRRSTEMHVTLHEDTGRAEDRKLFGYVALEAGQYFVGELVFSDRTDWEMLRALTGLPEVTDPASARQSALGDASAAFTLRVGKASRRGYGKMTATLFQARQTSGSIWEGLPLDARLTAVDQSLVMSLISDAIVLDSWGRSQQGFDAAWLSDALGVQVEIAKESNRGGADYELQFARGRMIDGFNNHLGLPRHRDIALAAGSAVTLEIKESLSLVELQARLRAVETSGIGIRQGEGFGRIIFNHPMYNNACAQVGDISIRLPKLLRLVNVQTDFDQETTFQTVWANVLHQTNWDDLKHEEFSGLVRDIRVVQLKSLDDVRNLLANYGKPDKVMTSGLPGRQKPNFFEEKDKQDGRSKPIPGLKLLLSLFQQLDQHAGNSSTRWSTGCAMLADQMGQIVPEKGER